MVILKSVLIAQDVQYVTSRVLPKAGSCTSPAVPLARTDAGLEAQICPKHLSEQSLTRNQNGAAEFTHRELVTASGPRGDPQTIVLMKGPGATTGDLDTRLGRTRVHVYLASALSHAGRPL
ncbi:hypothetical protein R6Z07F_010016 [Ovis aries]